MNMLIRLYFQALRKSGATIEADTFWDACTLYTSDIVDANFPDWVKFKRAQGPYNSVLEAGMAKQYSGTGAVARAAAARAQQLWEREL